MGVPSEPKIYHITHVNNLASICEKDLLSDAAVQKLTDVSTTIGMPDIKSRRLTELTVAPFPTTYVGEYVPFYFCPRSVMLYIIKCGNHDELTYRDGQEPIVHLCADLHEVVRWAHENGVKWAFTLSNAGAYYCEFRNNVSDLGAIDWPAVHATDWRDPATKESKQAEFLLHEKFPWSLVDKVGAKTKTTQKAARNAIGEAPHQPPVQIERSWYY